MNKTCVVHLSVDEIAGGAARAANRIHNTLLEFGINSRMVVLYKYSDSDFVTSIRVNKVALFFAIKINAFIRIIFASKKLGAFSAGLIGTLKVKNQKELKQADIISLHWVPGGFLSIFSIAKILNLGKPVVWRLPDTWPFSGGLHYSSSEKELAAPLRFRLLSKFIIYLKYKLWNTKKLTIVCTNRWIESQVRNSKVFEGARIIKIATGVDLGQFKPLDQTTSRQKFNLPDKKRLVLFGAVNSFDDHRKGGDLLVEALLKLSQKISNNDQMPDIVIFGGSVVPNDLARVFNCHVVGILNEEEELAAIYNACDVFVAPSREEALANTVLESTACGTPTVAFNIGGMPDSIVHKKTGYLANPYSIEDMAKGIDFCLNSHGKMTNDCVNLSEKSFSLKKNVYEYIKLFG